MVSFFLSIFEVYGWKGVPLLLGIVLDDDDKCLTANDNTYFNILHFSEDIDQVPIQQLCAIWNSYTRSLDDAPVNLVKGDAFYNASLLVISLSKLFLYISSHLSTTHFNLLIEGTDHYMQFQFNRWANGNYHPSLKICEGDLREIESKFNGM